MAARNGYKITVFLDDNPNSPTYMETYEERVEDLDSCPVNDDDLELVANQCEITISGYTGFRIFIYYNRTTGEYQSVKELDPECQPSNPDEIWRESGSPYCETTEKGINTGYMIQVLVQSNQSLPNYGETKQNKYKSPECGSNSCAIWDDISTTCHISVIDCVATFDGTADVAQIDINPLSPTFNQTRTINKQDSNCENCTNTFFSWIDVGTMCGDDELLCNNGLQQVSTNSYIVSQKYKMIGEKPPVPMNEYQINLKIEDDEDCGYIRPQYGWQKAVGQYICDFETYTKYEMYVRIVSYDEGVTWSVVEPIETERGDVIAHDSYDCGKPMYRWVDNGEIVCEDNGDDGKFIYWNENGVMTKSYPCNENPVLINAEYKAMSDVSDGITSPDGYKSTYQVGDCVSELASGALTYFNNKLWLGNYTEKLGKGSLEGYDQFVLEIPSRVNDMSNEAFGYDTNYHNLNILVMHPMTPPLLSTDADLPRVLRVDSTFYAAPNAAIFVPNEAYESYCNADVWSEHSNSVKGRLLPMNNDSVSYKAILDYEGDFTSWRYYVPDGESASTIGVEENIYGLSNITAITISDKVTDIADKAFTGWHSKRKLKSINLGTTVERIGYDAFKNDDVVTYVTDLVIPESVRSIGSGAFEGYELTSLTIHNGVETIGGGAFRDNELSSLTIPDSVKTIGGSAFYGNHYVMSRLEIGSGCTSLGSQIVYGVRTVVIKALTPPSIDKYTFGLNSNPTEIFVPCETYETYLEEWSGITKYTSILKPYGCSGEKVTIAVLHQSDGTDVNIQKPVESFRKILKQSDINPYSSTTTSIRVLTSCTEFDEIINIYNFSSTTSITLDSVIPPNKFGLYFNTNQLIFVPCEGYDVYYFILFNSYDSKKDNLKRIDDNCVDNLQYEWVYQSEYCIISDGKIRETQRKYIVIDGELYRTVDTRTVITSRTCFEITNNNGVTVNDTSMNYTGITEGDTGTLDFKYLVEGGVDVTLEVVSTGKPYYRTDTKVEVYDGDTLIASESGGPSTYAHLESFKQYHLVITKITNAGSLGGRIKFNNI